MPIQLDWNFEHDDLPDEAGPRWQPEPGPPTSRLWPIGLGLVGLLVVTAFVGGRARLQQVDRLRLQALDDTIAAETLALRIGDRDAFLAAQARIERWPDAQALAFDRYQQMDQPIVATGEVIAREVDGDLAQVTLRERIDDRPYQVVWFYAYGPQGWRHVPSRQAYWGDLQTYESDYYVVRHAAADRTYAEDVGRMLDVYVEEMCARLVCRRGYYPQRVTIETNALAFAFTTTYRTGSQVIASPQIGRVPEGGAADVSVDSIVNVVIRDQSWFLARNGWNAGMQTLDDDLDSWLTHELIPDVPDSSLFQTFEGVYGPDFVPDMMRMVALGNEARPSARFLLDGALIDEDDSLEQQLTTLLNFEYALRDAGYWSEATYLFNDPLWPYDSAQIDLESPVYFANDEPLEVASVEVVGDVVWAKVWYYLDFIELEEAMQRRATLQGFRDVNGQWYRIEAQGDDWGSEHSMVGDHVELTYQTMDDPYAIATVGRLDAIMAGASYDFDMKQVPTIRVRLTPVRAELGQIKEADTPDYWLDVSLPSPRLADTDYDRRLPRDPFLQPVLHHMLSMMLEESLGQEVSPYIEAALVRYEAQKYGLWSLDTTRLWLEQSVQVSDDVPVPTLDALMDTRDVSSLDEAVRHIMADHLIAVLVRDFGPDIVPVLVHHLRDSSDTYDWLAAVFADWDSRGEWPGPSRDYYGRIALIEGEVLSLTSREITNITDVQVP